jgi:hypothetical protein
MGQFGRKRVEEKLAWKYSVEKLLAAYAKTAKDGGGGAFSFNRIRRKWIHG